MNESDYNAGVERLTTFAPSSNIILSVLKSEDYRAKHITKILKLNPLDQVKCGIINSGITDNAFLDFVDKEGNMIINLGKLENLKNNLDLLPKVDLILAVPRPLRLEKILAIISCLGVRNLYLVGAEKVEKEYFGSQLFRRSDLLKLFLIEGLSQASVDCILPEVIVRKKLHHLFVHDNKTLFELHSNSSNEQIHRIIAHPPSFREVSENNSSVVDCINDNNSEERILIPSIRFHEFVSAIQRDNSKNQRFIIAVGPEGGWTESEVSSFEKKGFTRINLGKRILRTDIA
eukprot:gene8809-11894_t